MHVSCSYAAFLALRSNSQSGVNNAFSWLDSFSAYGEIPLYAVDGKRPLFSHLYTARFDTPHNLAATAGPPIMSIAVFNLLGFSIYK